jgi:two-component system chemotaxis response regulator CheY
MTYTGNQATSVLIVDDSRILRAAMRKAVRQAGVADERIREAGDGRSALDQIRVEEPDLVLLDVNMPVMDGERFLEEVEAADCFRKMCVIIVSTETHAKRLQRMAGLGAKARLKKPFEPEDLVKLIARFRGQGGPS